MTATETTHHGRQRLLSAVMAVATTLVGLLALSIVSSSLIGPVEMLFFVLLGIGLFRLYDQRRHHTAVIVVSVVALGLALGVVSRVTATDGGHQISKCVQNCRP